MASGITYRRICRGWCRTAGTAWTLSSGRRERRFLPSCDVQHRYAHRLSLCARRRDILRKSGPRGKGRCRTSSDVHCIADTQRCCLRLWQRKLLYVASVHQAHCRWRRATHPRSSQRLDRRGTLHLAACNFWLPCQGTCRHSALFLPI